MALSPGMLHLEVVEARHLIARDYTGKSDPFVCAYFGQQRKHKTHVKRRNLNPEWKETCTIEVPSEGGRVDIIVWDWDRYGDPDFMGFTSLVLGTESLELDQWLPLLARPGNKSDQKLLDQVGRVDFGAIHLKWKYEYSVFSSIMAEALKRGKREPSSSPTTCQASDFSPTVLKENLSRASDYVDILAQPVQLLYELCLWQRPGQSALTLMVFSWICYLDYFPGLPTSIVLGVLVRSYFIRLRFGAKGNFHLVDMNKKDGGGPLAFVRKYHEAVHTMAELQLVTGLFCDRLDTVSEVFTWQNYGVALRITQTLFAASVILTFLPLPPVRYLLFLLGFGMFTVFPLFTYFPPLFAASTWCKVGQRALTQWGRLRAWCGVRGGSQVRPRQALRQRAATLPRIQRTPAGPPQQVAYTCALCVEILPSTSDDADGVAPFQQQLLAFSARVGTSMDPVTAIDLLLTVVKRQRRLTRMFFIPPSLANALQGPPVTSPHHLTFQHLDFARQVPVEDYGILEAAARVRHGNHSEICKSLTPMTIQDDLVLHLGLLINCVFSDHPVCYYNQDKAAFLYKVFGNPEEPLETFQPAIASQAPPGVRALMLSCCSPDPTARRAFRDCASILGQQRQLLAAPSTHGGKKKNRGKDTKADLWDWPEDIPPRSSVRSPREPPEVPPDTGPTAATPPSTSTDPSLSSADLGTSGGGTATTTGVEGGDVSTSSPRTPRRRTRSSTDVEGKPRKKKWLPGIFQTSSS